MASFYASGPAGAAGGANPSVGTNTSAAPTSSTEIGFIDGSGNLQGVSATNPLPISGTISASNPSVGATGGVTPTSATLVGGTDGTDLRAFKVSSAGVLSVDGSAVTQPVSAASLPLPTGASTSALQTSGNSTLTSILADLTNGTQVTQISGTVPVSGTVAVSNFPATQPVSGSVSVSNFPATQPVSGTVTANQGTGGASAWLVSGTVTANAGTNLNTSTLALESGGNLASINGKFGSLGQKTMAGSAPVVIASDQSAIPISGTVTVSGLAAPTAFTTSVKALTASTATQVLATNTSRTSGLIQNNSSAPVWFGSSTVTSAGSTMGISILPGMYFNWDNTAALYGYSVNGASVVVMEET
jgi:hypothetical protein